MPSISSRIPEQDIAEFSYASTRGDRRGIVVWMEPDGTVMIAMGRHLTHRDFSNGRKLPSRQERKSRNGLHILVDQFDRNSAIALREALERLPL